MTTTEIEKQVRQFIVDKLHWTGSPGSLTSDYNLIEHDVLDSMGIFEIIGFVENQYSIEINDDELVPENFESLQAIAELVSKKT